MPKGARYIIIEVSKKTATAARNIKNIHVCTYRRRRNKPKEPDNVADGE